MSTSRDMYRLDLRGCVDITIHSLLMLYYICVAESYAPVGTHDICTDPLRLPFPATILAQV